jgi:DNA-binding CsgD family transcriptional regulator
MSTCRLSAPQLRRLNRVLLQLGNDVAEPLQLDSIIDHIVALLPGSRISVDELFRSGRVEHRGGRNLESVPQLHDKIGRYCPDNPVVSYAMRVGFAPALRISDFATFRQVRKTGYYNEMFRYLAGWRDQAALAIRLPESQLGFAINRDKVFGDDEMLMLELLHPHLERALHRCTQYLRLPSKRTLTPRERETLHWVAEGKRDHEIAVILRISERTIEQHVHACLEKLGVETRSAATAAVWRARMSAPES